MAMPDQSGLPNPNAGPAIPKDVIAQSKLLSKGLQNTARIRAAAATSLQDPQVQANLATPKINATQQVAQGAGVDARTGGTDIDRRFPRFVEINGKTVDVHTALNEHEQTEKPVFDVLRAAGVPLKKAMDIAHDMGLQAEKTIVPPEAWDEYTKMTNGILHATEHEPQVNPAPVDPAQAAAAAGKPSTSGNGLQFDPKTVAVGRPLTPEQTVMRVNPQALDAAFKATAPGSYDLVEGRMDRLKQFAASNPVSMAEVGAQNGRLSFTNGRTRVRLAAEQGLPEIPIAVDKANEDAVRALINQHGAPQGNGQPNATASIRKNQDTGVTTVTAQ